MLNKSAMLRLALAVSLMGAANLALAQSANANLGVTASVSKSCTISATALDFGAYDPIGTNATAPLNATGIVSVTCSKNSSGLTIGLNNGIQPSGTQRQLVGPTSADLMAYNITQPVSSAPEAACGTTTPWDNATFKLSIDNAPSKAARTFNVCGSIPAGLDVAAGNYTDTVIATINF